MADPVVESGGPAAEVLRTYTGEFPPGGPRAVDELVVALHKSVERVRIKYGSVVKMIASDRGISVAEALAQAESVAFSDLVVDGHEILTTEQLQEQWPEVSGV